MGRAQRSKSRELTSQQDREVIRSADSAYVMFANFSNEPLTIPKATILGVAEEASGTLIDGKMQMPNPV